MLSADKCEIPNILICGVTHCGLLIFYLGMSKLLEYLVKFDKRFLSESIFCQCKQLKLHTNVLYLKNIAV